VGGGFHAGYIGGDDVKLYGDRKARVRMVKTAKLFDCGRQVSGADVAGEPVACGVAFLSTGTLGLKVTRSGLVKRSVGQAARIGLKLGDIIIEVDNGPEF
jgi:hypothetical protein